MELRPKSQTSLTQSPHVFHCTDQASLTVFTTVSTVLRTITSSAQLLHGIIYMLYLTQLHEEGIFNDSHFKDGKTDIQRGQPLT